MKLLKVIGKIALTLVSFFIIMLATKIFSQLWAGDLYTVECIVDYYSLSLFQFRS